MSFGTELKVILFSTPHFLEYYKNSRDFNTLITVFVAEDIKLADLLVY